MYFHGTASSRLEIHLLDELASKGKLQIIGVDRPGYGLSTSLNRRNLQTLADDVNYLANSLGVKRFGLLGWSGGGVFALAFLSFFPKAVTNAVIVSAPSLPFDVSTAHNLPFARFIMKIPLAGFLAMKTMSSQVLKANCDVETFLHSRSGKQMLHGCSQTDLDFFTNPTWMQLMYQSMAEAFRQGNTGVKAVLNEHQMFTKPWSFRLSPGCADKLTIWHGAEDKTCRVENAYQLSGFSGSTNVRVFLGKGHCVMFGAAEELAALLKNHD